jgi:hypothetical protein
MYLKKPAVSRNNGLPFVTTRAAFLSLDKHYLCVTKLNYDLIGVQKIRTFLETNYSKSKL